MPAKTIKTTTKSEATKSAKTAKAAKGTKEKTAKTSASAKTSAKAVTKTSSTAKPAATKSTAAKASAKTATKPAIPETQAVNDARESNRLRQQRFLEKHRDEINVKRRERYAERKEGGQCPRCGKKLPKSSRNTLCKDCLEKARDYNQR